MNFNKVILMGRLVRDPVFRVTATGLQITTFDLCTNRPTLSRQGTMYDEKLFIQVAAFGRPAEIIVQYFSQGMPIHVEGRLKLNSWEKNGQKHSRITVVLETFHFIGNKPEKPYENVENVTPDAADELSPSELIDEYLFNG